MECFLGFALGLPYALNPLKSLGRQGHLQAYNSTFFKYKEF